MSPRSKKQFAEIRQKSKEIIMETALRLFATQGFYNTSINQIAKDAGVSKGLMYNYFESKDALLDEIIFGATEESMSKFDASILAEIPPHDRLKMFIEGTITMIQQNFHHWKLLTMLAFQSDIQERMKKKLEATKEDAIGRFVHLFEEMGAKDPKLEAFLVGAVLDGLFLHYMDMGEDYPLEDMKNYVIQRFCGVA